MRNPARTPFVAIFQNEVRLNLKRVAPYFMALLMAGHGLLLWGWGPATGRGLAINSDFVIASVLPIYAFLDLPLFTAVLMADPVSRDFRYGIDPLIFSKPISRAEYLLGKFFGNFFVLVCGQSAFVVAWFVLQGASKTGVTTQHFKIVPYIKHFLVFVVISHLLLAAFYFAVGVLTRNAKIVYGLGVAFYPVYIVYQTVILSSLPRYWKLSLDPLLMNRGNVHDRTRTVEWMNQVVVVYDTDLIVNRVVMIVLTAIVLTIVYRYFTIAERPAKAADFSVLNLTAGAGGFYYDPPEPSLAEEFEHSAHEKVVLPSVARATVGVRAQLQQLIAALGVEVRLLLSERSLVAILPLATFLSIFEVAFYNIPADISHSAAYATNTAKLLLLLLIGITVFYTGEAMHRDREVRMEPVLWSMPTPNYVLLLSKFLTTLLLAVSLLTLVGLAAMAIQLLRAQTPVDISAYLIIYSVVLLPTIVFVTAVSIAFHVLLRNKLFAYMVSIGIGIGLLYLYNLGHNHWLYNPALYQLWTYSDLVGSAQGLILTQRMYWLSLSCVCLALAHLGFRRKSATTGWALTGIVVSVFLAIVTGLMIR
jgi:ABC-type transport system involved in multi-copper enzyme maturation permease subunit